MDKVGILHIESFEQEEKLSDFYCNEFEHHYKEHDKLISAPHKHDFFLTVLFSQGSGIHEIDFERYEITSGSVFMLNPGQTHYWELSDDIEGVIFFHSKEFFNLSFSGKSVNQFPFFYSVHNPSILLLNENDRLEYLSRFHQILQEYRETEWMVKEKIVSLLDALYIDLSRLYLKAEKTEVMKSSKSSHYLRTLEALIDEHFMKVKSASTYAEMLNITTRHLNRLTQEALGKSTNQMIAERVILEAKRLLVFDSSSLATIGYQLGYEEYPYFSRFFKKWTGMTPSEFAKVYQ